MPSALQHIELGHYHRRQGDLTSALAEYECAVRLAPENAEALSLCGLVLLHLGHSGKAGPLLQRAVERDPSNVGFMLNLASFLELDNQLDEAAKLLQRALVVWPDFHQTHARLGNLHERRGDWEAAFRSFQSASERSPLEYDLLVSTIRCALLAGLHDEAQRLLVRASSRYLFAREVLNLYCDLFNETQKWLSLLGAAREWSQRYPGDSRSWYLLSRAQFETGNFGEALESFERYLLTKTAFELDDIAVYATTAMQSARLDKAAVALSDASQLGGGFGNNLEGLRAQVYLYFGHFDQARSICLSILESAPNEVNALRILSLLDAGGLPPELIETVIYAAEEETNTKDNRSTCHFVAAEYYNANAEFDTAFAHYTSANQIARQQNAVNEFKYVAADRERFVDLLLESFGSREPEDGSWTNRKAELPTPLFIIGMPRSGTTFLETLLCKHPQVYGLGEREIIPSLLRKHMSAKSAASKGALVRQFIETYFGERIAYEGALVVIDKNPFNFESVGLIKSVFPNSIIVHTYRDPWETCWSIFRNEFIRSITFANGLEDIAHYYRQYRRLIDHWDQLYPGTIVHLDHAKTMRNTSQVSEHLWSLCGLDLPALGSEVQQTRPRPIQTLSSVQVRATNRAIGGGAEHYWKFLPKEVQALFAALRRAN